MKDGWERCEAVPSTKLLPERVMKYRNLHNLDSALFLKSIMLTLSSDYTSLSPDEMINLYNTTLTTSLNTLTPKQLRKATFQTLISLVHRRSAQHEDP
ncbi:hypothetical protein SKAU_G00363760 [Synaphobranchus kaupii]|uniref:Uncharacterized protein n=1 Tax=Synaphobranchus kaupii TaxID=118154 RepID=A0A9Q1EIV8_SYNKA|nr:hypothetical protein SKAU_G00363760 [Synaphobranchus kaupii]